MEEEREMISIQPIESFVATEIVKEFIAKCENNIFPVQCAKLLVITCRAIEACIDEIGKSLVRWVATLEEDDVRVDIRKIINEIKAENWRVVYDTNNEDSK